MFSNSLIGLILFSLAQSFADEHATIHAWPVGYLNQNDDLVYYFWEACPMNLNCTSPVFATGGLEKQMTREYTYMASNFTIKLYRIILYSSRDESVTNKLNLGQKHILKVDEVQIPALKSIGSYFSHDLFALNEVRITGCSQGNSLSFMKVPCDAHKFTLENICESEWVCQMSIRKSIADSTTFPERKIGYNHDNSSVFNSAQRRCFPILTFSHEEECELKFSRIKETNSMHKSFCSLSASRTDSRTQTINVPGEIGSRICLTHKSTAGAEQLCKVVEKTMVTFIIPSDSSKIAVQCGSSEQEYIENSKINCPLTSVALSDAVCASVRNPRIFWISVAWLFVGLPILFLSSLVYLYINRWLTFRQFKVVDTCEYCCQWYGNVLTMKLHDRCEAFFCPYCNSYLSSKRLLISHALNCNAKNETIGNIDEIIKSKWDQVSCRLNGINVYTSKLSRVLWVIIFMSLFLSSFASNGNHHRRHSAYKPSRSSSGHYLKNSNVNPEALPDLPSDHSRRIPLYERENDEEDEREHELPKPTFANGEALLNAKIDLLADSFSNLDVNIRNSLNDMPTRSDVASSFHLLTNDLFKSLSGMVAQALADSTIEKKNCEMSMSDIDISQLYPMLDRKKEGHDVMRIHKDDAWKIFDLASKWQKYDVTEFEGNDKGSSVRKMVHVEESAAVAQAGRAEIQIAIGGGHSKPELALGGSTQNKVDLQGQYDDPELSPDVLQQSMQNFRKRLDPNREERRRRISDKHRRNKRGIEEDNVQARLAAKKVKLDQKSYKLKNTVLEHKFIHIKDRMVIIPGTNEQTKAKVSMFKMGKPMTFKNKEKDFKSTHENWSHYEETACKTNCLHIPHTCECITSNLPDDGIVKTPWATINVFDEKPFKSKLSFSQEMALKNREEGNIIFTQSFLSGKIDLTEGNSMGWEIITDGSTEKHTVTLSILKIATIYKTKFLYWTCDRSIETEVKDFCTGECGDYCGGRVCLGSEVWKWDNCRNWRCNPSWCLSIGDGCCCCGNNVYCKNARNVLGAWELEPVKTEFLFCLYHNDRAYHCQTVDDPVEYSIDNFKIGIDRAPGYEFKHPKHVATLHKIIKSGNGDTVSTVSEPEKIYLDPNICWSASECNHGSIGDLQANSLNCLMKVGKICADTKEKLAQMECANGIYFSESGSQMTMSCVKFDYHKCHHHNSVKHLDFGQLDRAVELNEEFVEKKISVNAKSKEMLFMVTSKRSSGSVEFQLTVDNLEFKKLEFKPKLREFTISECSGCYSCDLGFNCKASVVSDSEESFLITLSTSSDRLTLAKHSVTIHSSHNLFNIWGFSFVNVEESDICIHYGNKDVLCEKVDLNLKEPEGNYIPIKEDDIGSAEKDYPVCSGMKWFSCAWQSLNSFSSGFWNWIYKFWWTFIIAIIILVFIMFFPYISAFVIGLLKMCNCFRRNKKFRMPKREEVLSLAKTLKDSKMTKLKERKKFDDEVDDLELLPLFSRMPPEI